MRVGDFEREIEARLKGAKKIIVMAVGDELDPRDCLGVLAGRRISSARLGKVKVLQTSQMPENYTSVVRREMPTHVVIIDAADFGGRPGDVALIAPELVAATRVSTHAMPLSVLMKYLAGELRVRVLLIGIQPPPYNEVSAAGTPPGVERGIQRLISVLKRAIRRGTL